MSEYVPVTALVPVTRGAAALPCVFSVCNQTRPPDRVVLYDVGPSDNRLEGHPLTSWLLNYLGVELHAGPCGQGVSAARNYLVEQVRTPLFWCLDDDEIAWHTALQDLLAAMEVYSGVAAVSGVHIDMVPDRLEQSAQGFTWRRDFRRRWVNTLAPIASPSNLLCRTAAWRAVDTTYEGGERGGEDTVITAQLGRLGLLSYGIPVIGSAFTLHMRSVRSSYWAHLPDNAWLGREVRPYIQKLDPGMYRQWRRSLGVPDGVSEAELLGEVAPGAVPSTTTKGTKERGSA